MWLGELDRILVLRTAMLIRTGLAAAAFGLFLFKLDVFVGSVGRESVFHLRAENADVPVAVAAAMPDWQWLRFEPPSKCTARLFPVACVILCVTESSRNRSELLLSLIPVSTGRSIDRPVTA